MREWEREIVAATNEWLQHLHHFANGQEREICKKIWKQQNDMQHHEASERNFERNQQRD